MNQHSPCGSFGLNRPLLVALALGVTGLATRAAVVFDTISPYHHIQVIDANGVRTLSFNGSQETRMSLADPLQGHFEYTELFHLPRLWNPQMKRVLLIGLGGGSTHRAYRHYYPEVALDTAELDPEVIRVASNYFGVAASASLRIHNADGRVFLRRTPDRFDAIIIDAYTAGRYGSFIPYHLATKEFFESVRDRLTTNGVVAYNVIGSLQGYKADIVGALHATLKSVFPQVYLFRAGETRNVVVIATRTPERFDRARLLREAGLVTQGRRVRLATLSARAASLADPPPGFARAPVLTDDKAPVDGLLGASSP